MKGGAMHTTPSIKSTPHPAAKQALAERGNNRTQQPDNATFQQFIGEDWGERPASPQRLEIATYTPARRAALAARFPGKILVFPAGDMKVRSNDTDYRFRAHSAFSHLTGLGGEHEPGAVLVIYPQQYVPSVDANKPTPTTSNPTPETDILTLKADTASLTADTASPETATADTPQAILYFHPRASRSSKEFYADPKHGEFWVGARPSLEDMTRATGLPTRHIDYLENDLEAACSAAGSTRNELILHCEDPILAEAASELRLKKDAWEIKEMRKAVAATKEGFENMIRSLPRAVQHWRGERVLEGAFGAKAREEGNGLGYDTIIGSGNHANTLHWIANNGRLRKGDLVLIDAGVEMDSLYTADITRTLPVTGHFTPTQRMVYQAVLDACEAALAQANEKGARFKDVHHAAMQVIAARLEEWGLLPASAEESLKADGGQYHRRWMPHGTSHHLGIDVHDCAQAKKELYQDALLEPGMIFTIEPGLYFRDDDLKVPPELRGIGVRIEDDVLVTEHGAERLSEDIPRTIEDVEEWMARLLAQ